MKLKLFAAALTVSALGGACFADVAPTSPPAAATPPAAGQTVVAAATPMKHGYDPNTQICKWTDDIGTRLGHHKTCMSRAQWDQLSRDSQDGLLDSQNRGAELSPPSH
ncbi:MAG TPA: hypothetical protein VII42_14900 [Caulobacteraceae bacterium]